MKATVKYNNDHEPHHITVGHERNIQTEFTVDGGKAVAQVAMTADGEDKVYFQSVSEHLEYVRSLPFVQAVTLDSELDNE